MRGFRSPYINIFFQIHTLVTFPSHLKKLHSILRFWLDKLNCWIVDCFTRFTRENNFSCQNFSVENSYFFIFCQIFDIFDDIFFSEPLSLSILEIQLEMSCPGPTLNPLSNLLLKRNYLYLPMKYIKTMFMLMDVNFTLSKRYI